jgi:class 3 adenylate cyclase
MRSTTQIAAPHRHIGNRLPFGALAYAGAGISMVFCFAKTIVLYVFLVSGIGIAEFAFNPHLQAILMWLFALMGVIGLSLDKPRCGSSIPMVMGLLSFIIIVGTLYGRYHTPVLMMGYTLLLSAAFLNQSLRLRQLNLQVAEQADSLKSLNETLKSLNATLEQRVTSQVQEIESLGRLKRFLAPAVAELLVNEGENRHLDNHRRHIATLFCDIRGFTSFSESMEPEEVMGVLAAYHEQMGRLASKYKATIDHRAGDGLMLFFNDPIPCDDPELKAVQLALDMREAFESLNERWKKLGYNLGFGIGIASGYATMGIVGFEGRYDYTANGNAVNVAARLCDQAENGQILISRRALVEVENQVRATPVGELHLKGVSTSVATYNIDGLVGTEPSAKI